MTLFANGLLVEDYVPVPTGSATTEGLGVGEEGDDPCCDRLVPDSQEGAGRASGGGVSSGDSSGGDGVDENGVCRSEGACEEPNLGGAQNGYVTSATLTQNTAVAFSGSAAEPAPAALESNDAQETGAGILLLS